GLALAVGILVDEATVMVENVHTQMLRYENVARAVLTAGQETAVPRLLAMLCILAVFIPSFFMSGAARELFVPLSLAVGFAMIASYVLSSTFLPVLSVWLLEHTGVHTDPKGGLLDRLTAAYAAAAAQAVRLRRLDQKERLRDKLDAGLKAWLVARWKEDGLSQAEIEARLPGLRLSFEPGDLVSEVMSFGAATPVEVHVSSPNMANNLAFAGK